MDDKATCFAGSDPPTGGLSFAWQPSVPGMYAVSNQRSIQFSRRPESASQEDQADSVTSESPGNVTSLSFSPAGGKLAAVSSGNQACPLPDCAFPDGLPVMQIFNKRREHFVHSAACRCFSCELSMVSTRTA